MPTECLFCHKLTQLDQLPPDEIVWKFPYSIAFLGPWQYYHGYCILVYRFHATELSQLGVEDRLNFLDELCIMAKAIEDCVQPKKMNYEMLGNQTPHMHWHLIPRFKDDPDAKHPIWFAIEKVKLDKPQRQKLKKGPESSQRTIEALQHKLRETGAGHTVMKEKNPFALSAFQRFLNLAMILATLGLLGAAFVLCFMGLAGR